MLVSDFLFASTTHELLYRIFASETGLASVSHPEIQHQALVEAMKPLKANILDKLAESATLDFYNGDHSHAGTLTIPLKEDAQLFMEVYRDFNRFPVEDAVARHVYLVAGRMIARNVEMKRLVLRQLQYHINQYPDAVAHRIFDTLMIFDLSELVPPLKEVLQSRSFPAT